MDRIVFSSKSDDWSTPQEIFDSLNQEFGFTLDACADSGNHKCERYITEEQNGLESDWGGNWCSAIHLTAKLPNGCRNATKSRINQGQLLFC